MSVTVDQKRAYHRAYMKKWRRFAHFGIDEGRFYALIDEQKGCGICSAPYNDAQIWVPVRNEAGVVLGVVCPRCAKAVWLLGYDPERLYRAADFLVTDPPEEYPYDCTTHEDVGRLFDDYGFDN